MNVSSDSADTVYLTAKAGIRTAARITGEAAEAAARRIRAALADAKPGKGKDALEQFLRDGRECRVFRVPDEEKTDFFRETKTFGIPFCVVLGPEEKEAFCDVVVRAEDAPRVSRILERRAEADRTERGAGRPTERTDRSVPPSDAPSRSGRDAETLSEKPSVLAELKEIRATFERAGAAARIRARGDAERGTAR